MKKIIVFMLSLTFLISITGCSNKTEAKQKTFTYEYGKKISKKASHYLDGSDVDDYKIKITGIDQYQDILKVNPPKGIYKAEAINEKDKIKFNIKIVDTKKPIIDINKAKLPVGSDISNLNNILTNKIYDKVGKEKINCQFVINNASKINFKKAGTYHAEVTATDSNKNKQKKSITINIFDMKGKYVCDSPYQEDRKMEYNSDKETVTYVNYIDKKSEIGKEITKLGSKKYVKKMQDAVVNDRPNVVYEIEENKKQYILKQIDTKKIVDEKQFSDMMEGNLTSCRKIK